MNSTFAPHDGPRAGSYTLASSQAMPVVVQAGVRATLEVLQVHMGLQGEAGAVGGAYTHTQSAATASWTVNHNLGYRPAIKALSLGGVEFWGEVLHVSVNQAILYFDSPNSGLAICS